MQYKDWKSACLLQPFLPTRSNNLRHPQIRLRPGRMLQTRIHPHLHAAFCLFPPMHLPMGPAPDIPAHMDGFSRYPLLHHRQNRCTISFQIVQFRCPDMLAHRTTLMLFQMITSSACGRSASFLPGAVQCCHMPEPMP